MGYTWNKSAVKWLLDKCKATFLPKDQFKEAYLGWGGKDLSSNLSPIDGAMSALHSANRSELCTPEGITIEYTTDRGATWVDYGASDEMKVRLLSAIGTDIYLGKTTESTKNKNIGLRVTLDARKMGLYTSLKKILINYSTSGLKGTTVQFEHTLLSDESKWVSYKTVSISGWSGWNSYYYPFAFGGGMPNNVTKIRMTFFGTDVASGSSNRAEVMNILILGTTYWSYPSTLAKTGHLYSYDWQGNATFPNGLTAKTLNGHTLHSDVPAGAKFTDTTYGLASQVANGLMSAGDKVKLDGLRKPRVYQNIQVAASVWGSGAGEVGGVWTRWANIPIDGVNASMYAQVVFNPNDHQACNFASMCATYDNRVVIFAETAPGYTITIPTIIVWDV